MTPTIRKILVPTDFSDCSDKALEYALVLRERFGATLELLHVWEIPQGVGVEAMPFIAMQGGDRLSLMDYVRSEAERSLADTVEQLKRRGVEVQPRLLAGHAASAILDAAKDADLVVIGSQGRGAVMHFLLGSVAERVVRKAKAPVLVVRSEAS